MAGPLTVTQEKEMSDFQNRALNLMGGGHISAAMKDVGSITVGEQVGPAPARYSHIQPDLSDWFYTELK